MKQTDTAQDLFAEFAASTKEEWRRQVVKELKGKAWEELVWQTPEGYPLEPYYTAEDVQSLPVRDIQQAQRIHSTWLTRVPLSLTREEATRQEMGALLEKGAQAFLLHLGDRDARTIDWQTLLGGLPVDTVPIVFKTNRSPVELLSALKQATPFPLLGSVYNDPVAHWMQSGLWPADVWSQLTQMHQQTEAYKVCTVDGTVFHNAGANAVQELACTLALAVTYVDRLTDEGVEAKAILQRMEISMAVGTSYLTEIAKLRALRYLMRKISHTYHADGVPVFLHVQTSSFYQAALEPYTNVLRSTTQAMAAVVGGCDALTVLPYNQPWEASDDFSQRIARNVSTILKEELYLDKVADPSAGAYYIEFLTYQLAKQAWTLRR